MTTETKNLIKQTSDLAQEIKERPSVPPAVDIYENDDEYLVVADLPGVDRSALEIRLHHDELTIEGRRESVATGSLLAGDAELTDFKRVFRVPETIEPGNIDAKLDRGVLRVRLPKSEAVRPRKIPIKSA